MGERIRFSHKLDFCPPSFKKDKILVKVQKLVDPDGMSFMGNYGPANLKRF